MQEVVRGLTLRLRQSISSGEVARPAESSSGADAPSPTKYFLGEVARPAGSSSGADAPSPTKYFLGEGGTSCRK